MDISRLKSQKNYIYGQISPFSFSHLCIIITFFLLLFEAVKLYSMPEKTFYLSFDKGTDADFSVGSGKVLKAVDTSFAPGINGQGLSIRKNSCLRYASKKNINGSSGSLSVWLKLDWTPRGIGTWPDRTAGSEPFRKTFHEIFAAGNTLQAVINAALKYGTEYYVINQVFAGDWNHFVFTWKNGTINAYLNGRLLRTVKRPNNPLYGYISLGSNTPKTLGLEGTMDELNIYKEALSRKEVMNLYCQYFPVSASLMDYVAEAGKKSVLRLRFINHSSQTQQKSFKVTINRGSGAILLNKEFPVKLNGNSSVTHELEFLPPEAKDYRVRLSCGPARMASWEITAISSKSISALMPLSKDGKVKMKLLENIDCTQPCSQNKYRDDGHCRVVTSKAGTYRETSLRKANSGFAYRFKIRNPGRPHWLEIKYPDDTDRMFFVAVYPYTKYYDRVMCSGNLDTIGIISGGLHPISNTMQSKRLLFWPDSTDMMLVCGSYKLMSEAGAALAEIKVYENEGPLPRLELNYPEGLPRRVVDLWQEDPTMEGLNWFNRPECYPSMNFSFWKTKAERMVKYLRFMGIGQWSFLVMDYFGDKTGALNYQLYSSYLTSSSGHIPGWCDLLAKTFDREDIPFMVELNHRYRFEKKLNEGSLGHVIGSEHHSKNLQDALARGRNAIEQFSGNDTYKASSLNPLHPIAQKGWLKLIRTYRDKFCIYEQFQGINIISPVQLRFDNALSGVGDWNIACFEKDTGIKVPVDVRNPRRFSLRFNWLKKNVWEKWLDWRCRKIRDFYVRALAVLNAVKPGKKILARMVIRPEDNYVCEALASGKKSGSLYKLYRECGVDLAMLSKVKGLLIMLEIAPNRERVIPERVDEAYYNFSPQVADVFKKGGKPAVLVSRHANIELYWTIGKTMIKNLWWKTGTYIYDNMSVESYSTAHPNNSFVMEHMAWALAEIDPVLIDHGWWGCPENGSPELFQPFYQAYQSIPALHFVKVTGTNDHVTLRYCNMPDKDSWFYLVNKSPDRQEVELLPGFRIKSRITDAVNGNVSDVGKNERIRFSMKGFETKVLRSSIPLTTPQLRLLSVPEDKIKLKKKLSQLHRQLQTYKAVFGRNDEAVSNIIRESDSLFEAGKYTQCEHRLRSKAIKKMQSELACNLRYSMTTDGSLLLTYTNITERPVNGCISVRSVGFWSNPVPGKLKFKELKPGECFSGTVRFDAPNLFHNCKYRFNVQVEVEGLKSESRDINIYPHLAFENNSVIKIDARLNDWNRNTSWYKLNSNHHLLIQKPQNIKTKWQAKYAWNWNREGLYLAVIVEDQHGIFPQVADSKMWNYDSLQVYIDPRNNKSGSYDSDDLVYLVTLVHDKVLMRSEYVNSKITNEGRKKIQAAVIRNNGKTVYEVFFPGELLSGLSLANNSMTGFSLLINNRDKSENGNQVFSCLSPCKQSPYLNPAVWKDLILVSGNPVRGTAYIYGEPVPSPAKGKSKCFIFSSNKKKGLFSYSNLLNDQWTDFSFSFIPRHDGKLKICLSGIWVPKGMDKPQVWFRNVKATGTLNPVVGLDKWTRSSKAILIERKTGPELKLDWTTRIATEIQVKKDVEVNISMQLKKAFDEPHQGAEN